MRGSPLGIAAVLAMLVAPLCVMPKEERPRDRIALDVLAALEVELTPCWGRIYERPRPIVLICGTRDTSDLSTLRKSFDELILARDGVQGTAGRWTWRNSREYMARDYETETGLLTARIYYTKNLVGLSYPFELDLSAVEAVPCATPGSILRSEAPPRHEQAEGFEPAVQIVMVPAVYPERALAVRMNGLVEVRARILADGSVGEVCLIKASPTGMGFEEAAVAAVRVWRYGPARLGGVPVETVLDTVVEFKP